MRKYPIVFLLALINPISCSNFALPEQVHVKAEINPTVPVNNSGRFDFSKQFQEALNAMFSSSLGEDEKNAVKVFDYRGDEDDVQKFLIAFSLKEQTLDFKEYFSRDLNLDSGFQNIKQTFKLDELTAAENSKISLDMSDTISDILGTIKFPDLRMPCTAGPEFNSPSIPVEVEGFISLSFYDGYLAARFSFNGSGEVRLRNLRVNSSIPSVPSSCTVTPNNPQEVRFPLKGKTLEKSFSLSFSYASTGDGELASAIGFSDDVRIKTAKGVSFNPINGARFEDSEIALSVPPEFVQAKIGSGSISMDASALKGVNLDLGGMRITQELNEDAPPYQDPDSTALLELKEGLGSLTLRSGKFDLAGQKFNPKAIKISGAYSMTADQNSAEITFTEDKKLEIPVSFAMERFDEVYVNGQTIIDEFNQKSGKMEEPLDNLSQTVSSITIKDAGVKLTFGNCIDGLKLHIESEQFKVDETDFIEPGTTKSFTTLSTNVNTKPFPLDITENSTITIDLKLEGSGTIPVLKLPPMASGENVTIIDCTPEVVFDWEAAAIKLREAFTKGRLPESGKGFSLDGKDLKTFMNNIEIDERIIAYFFLSGPQGLKGDDMTLILTSFPGTDWEISLAKDSIDMVPKPLSLPEDDQPFTENIDESERSVDPIDFTRTFNQMLPGMGNNKGKPLIVDYTMDGLEGKELTITKSMVEDADGVKTIKAELVIVIPLKLRARAGGATIDATNYLGGMIGQNLLNFADRDLAEISLDPLTLNITLSGTPIDGGHLIVERNAAADKLFDDEKNQPIKIDLSHEKNIRIPLAENLTGQSFTLQSVRLELEEGGSLQVPRGLSLLSLGVNTGIDTTFDL